MTAKKPTPSKAASPAAKATKPAAVELKKKVAPVKLAEPVAKGKGVAPKKGKADDKAAKPEASDVDLSDLEAELEELQAAIAAGCAPADAPRASSNAA